MPTERPLPNVCIGCVTKKFDGEIPVQEVSGMWNISSLLLLPDQLGSSVVVPVRVPSTNRIVLFNYLSYLKPLVNKQMINIKLNY